jgi:hypothetical protein
MSPSASRVVHYLIVAVTAVAAFAPNLPVLQTLLPAQLYQAVALACAVALWLMQSPLWKPLLPVKTPDEVIKSETSRAIDLAEKKSAS